MRISVNDRGRRLNEKRELKALTTKAFFKFGGK